MSWKDAVKTRFSEGVAAKKWDKMYESQTEALDDDNFRKRRDYAVEYILKNYDKDAKLCDLGCGSGPVTYELIKRGYEVVGIDYSVDMLRNAKRRLNSAQIKDSPLVRGNGECLPFADGKFDCVICLGVISYVEEYENILEEIFRILTNDGTALISYRSQNGVVASDPVTLVKHIVKKYFLRKKADSESEFEIGQYMYLQNVLDAVTAKGFILKDFAGIGFGPYRFRGKELLSGRSSIKLSNLIAKMARTLRAKLLFKLITDVHVLTFRKAP